MTTLTPPLAAVHEIDPLLIDSDPTQPRQEFDQVAQAELEASIREAGILQPLRVAPTGDGRYRLLYGERRLRAALALGLPLVPCIVEEVMPTWQEALDTQLIENLHRAELRPLEIAQTLWRRILGANIEALEEEQGDDGRTTAQILANYLTPVSQIVALEDRLCQLADVATVAEYFQGGRVRVPRKTILARYGMADWSESRLKKLFGTLEVAPAVQDMLAGVDVSARALRDLAKCPPEAQADLVEHARQTAAGNGDVGGALRGALDERAPSKQKANKQSQQARQTDVGDDLAGDADATDEPDTPLDDGRERNDFTPDPSLAFLTSTGGHAPKLITDRPAPTRGTPPPVSRVGEWDEDHALQIEATLDAALAIFDDAGIGRFAEYQKERFRGKWRELVELMQHAGMEA